MQKWADVLAQPGRTYTLPATLFLSWEFSAFPTCSTSYFNGVSQMLCRAENNQEKHLCPCCAWNNARAREAVKTGLRESIPEAGNRGSGMLAPT